MIPPFIGFFAKLYILLDTLDNSYFFISFIAILSSMIGAVNYLRVIVAIHFENIITNKNIIKVQESISSVIALITMLIILFFIYPSPIFNFIFFSFD